jgi:DNA polymerase-3 subunit alpha
MLRNHSHYSLLLSTQKPKDIVKRCKELGYKHAGICDIGSISGVISFLKACKENEIIPIIGSEIVLKDGSSICLFCKNINAWKNLLVVISRCNDEDNYDKGAKISFEELITLINPQNFVCVDGYLGSRLARHCLGESIDFADVESYNIADPSSVIQEMQNIFGEDYYIEIDDQDSTTLLAIKVLREALINTNVKKIPFSSSFYNKRCDSIDHRVILCSKLKTTLERLQDKIEKENSNNTNLLMFIRNSSYYIRSINEDNFSDLISKITQFNILSNPKLPSFSCPSGMSQEEYLKELCRSGWRKLIKDKIPAEKQEEYKNRVLYELGVISNTGLSGYFLIVQDYVNHFRSKGYLIGPGRGSGAGSLVCYLLGITLVDPIEYGLLFERFFNGGRFSRDKISFDEYEYNEKIN